MKLIDTHTHSPLNSDLILLSDAVDDTATATATDYIRVGVESMAERSQRPKENNETELSRKKEELKRREKIN